MATIQTSKQRTGEHVISHANGHLSQDNVTVKLAEVLVAGQLVQEDTPAAAGVLQVVVAYAGGTALGPIWADVDATDAAGLGVVHKRACELDRNLLTGLDPAAEIALALQQVIIREDV